MTAPSQGHDRAPTTREGFAVLDLVLDLASEGRRFIQLWGIGRDVSHIWGADGGINKEAFERHINGECPEVCRCPLRADCPTPGVHPIYDLVVEDATSDVAAMKRWPAIAGGWIGEVLDDGSIVVLEADVSYNSTIWRTGLQSAKGPPAPVSQESPPRPRPAPARRTEDLGPSTALYSVAHAWAHWWAQQGFRVFRVCGIREEDGLLVGDCWTRAHDNPNWECWPRPTVRKVCTHPKPGKSPFVKSWKKEATTDRNAIDRWFRESPGANYAVMIEPGYVVLDFDTPDAKHSWRDGHQEVAELGDLPPTRTFLTGGGGEHRLFRTDHDNGCSLPAFEGLHMKGIVDVKAYGLGYIIGTGSRHHSGSYYTCPDPTLEIAPTPEWLYDSPLDPKPGRRRGRSKAKKRIEAGHQLRAAYIEDPDATLSPGHAGPPGSREGERHAAIRGGRPEPHHLPDRHGSHPCPLPIGEALRSAPSA